MHSSSPAQIIVIIGNVRAVNTSRRPCLVFISVSYCWDVYFALWYIVRVSAPAYEHHSLSDYWDPWLSSALSLFWLHTQLIHCKYHKNFCQSFVFLHFNDRSHHLSWYIFYGKLWCHLDWNQFSVLLKIQGHSFFGIIHLTDESLDNQLFYILTAEKLCPGVNHISIKNPSKIIN